MKKEKAPPKDLWNVGFEKGVEATKIKIAEDVKDDEKWDLEPCCHAISRKELVKYLTGELFLY